ncbi:MAG: alcohol dehydrogenase catalytic domain-containing protein, partial [Novosphingobium sp.]
MKALRTHAVGGPETLTLDDLPDPVAGPGQVVVAVKVCAINFPDTLMIRDMYQFKPQRPYAPGGEFSGVIESVGEGVTGWKAGDRVIGMCGNGGLAEKVALEAHRLFPLPDDVSFETGASLLMTYGTTIHGLKDRGHIKAGDTLLVLGAAGG